MTYTRAFSTLGCPELTLEAAVALALRHGIDGIELRALGGALDLPAHFTGIWGDPAHAVASRPAVPVTALATSLKLIGHTPADREAFLRFVPWAEALRVPWLRVFDGGTTATATELAAGAATIRWWRELRARHGWQTDLMVETHDSLLTAATIGRFLAAAPGTAIRWDSHHTWKKGGEDPLVTWRALRSQIVSIDVKDSVSRSSGRHPYTYVLPGEGEFPMAPLRAVLQKEYTGTVSLEWEKLWHPYLPPIEDALQVATQHGWW